MRSPSVDDDDVGVRGPNNPGEGGSGTIRFGSTDAVERQVAQLSLRVNGAKFGGSVGTGSMCFVCFGLGPRGRTDRQDGRTVS